MTGHRREMAYPDDPVTREARRGGAVQFLRAPGRMTISAIRVSRFRNHAETAVKFGIGINALLGENAQGRPTCLKPSGTSR